MSLLLNPKQLDLLRLICRQDRPVPADELDQRVARALINRGLVDWAGEDRLTPTDAGRAYLEEGPPRPRRRRRKGKQESGRSAAIVRIVEQLEEAIPPDAEVRVGNIQAGADELLDAFRRHARRLRSAQQ
jgi:hypothetical protein